MKTTSIPFLFIAAFGLFFATIFGLKSLMFDKLEISPESTLGKPLPDGMQIISSLKVENGTTLNFYNPLIQHKVSLTRSKAPAAEPPSGETLIDAVIKFQTDGGLDDRLSKLSLQFLSAEVNGRRASNITVFNSLGNDLTSFVTNRGANYTVSAIRKGGEEFLLIVYRKDKPVDLRYVEELLNLIS